MIATGGVPDVAFLAEGADLATTSWDILSGQAAPAREVLLFDDHGGHPGASCAEFLAEAGARLEFVTPERIVLPEIGGTNYPAYLKAFGEHGVRVTLNRRLRAIRREGNRLAATLYDEYARTSEERLVDQVVIERGTLPADDLYFELRPRSSNLGEIDQGALLAGRPQNQVNNPDGGFQLFRVGDAVASRTETEEKRLRADSDAIADRVLLVGGYDAGALEDVRRTVLAPAALMQQGAEELQQAALYRLLHCITEPDLVS